MPRWTDEQTQAINEEGCDILVSAGAGSGKTAVLSERALRKVEGGTSIDQILILTFTKAAAFEMMIRIREKIRKKGMDEQVKKIDKAYITTFDSFALSIVRKYHDLLNINKHVSIVDENVISLLKKEVLDTIFDEYYQSDNYKFNQLIQDFCLKDDREIKKYILDLNQKLDLKYNKIEYLESYLDNYYNKERILEMVLEYENLIVQEIDKINEELRVLELSLDGDKYYLFLDVLKPLLKQKTYDGILSCLDITLPRLPNKSEEDVKNSRDSIKKILEKVQELCSYSSKSEMMNNFISTKDHVEIIIEIIKILDDRINSYKFLHDTFEFVDISKLAIDLVMKHETVLEELKNYFNEIMIDEYQDTSDLQEQFIQLIKNNNTYMVGDIKQSIYRFRNANPYIFKKKYDDYTISKGGKKIDLNKNFRSRCEVLENINDVFDLIMDDLFGGAVYTKGHQMVFGNQTYLNEGYTNQNYNIECYQYHIEKDGKYSNYNKDEVEAFIIANDIKKKIADHYQVFDKDSGMLRDIRYQDFVILMDRSSKFSLYKKIFEYLEIPLTILRDENIANQDEIFLIYRILKLINCVSNKQFDSEFRYSYMSISRSYLFAYNDRDIFKTISNQTYFDTDILKIVNKIISKMEFLDLVSLISMIIDEFNFYEKMITVGDVSLSITTLDYLLDLATNLQELGYDYIRFLEYLTDIITLEKQIKLPVSVESKNSCRIMTIHKSKGLEYPVCYYSGLAAAFNVSELKEKILYDEKYGILVPYFQNGYQDIFLKALVKNKYYQDEISEKIRLFYVALTRCREKMIIVADLNEEESRIDDGVVSNNRRFKYRSFLDILKSIYSIIEKYIVPVEFDSLSLSKDYNFLSKREMLNRISHVEKLEVSEYKTNNLTIDLQTYSKKSFELLDKKTIENIEFGNRIHELFEVIDFKKRNFEEMSLSDFELDKIKLFFNQPLLENVMDAKILKEYEFITYEKSTEKHGIIDLMLEYDNHIDIIDYKLKYIDEENYIKQLKGYYNYISKKTDKKVNIYLYSILDGCMKSIPVLKSDTIT